jgi:hypothetical protein
MIATAAAPYPLALDERIRKALTTRKRNFEARNERIRMRFNALYNQERKRIDDVIVILTEEFCLSKSTIESVLKG